MSAAAGVPNIFSQLGQEAPLSKNPVVAATAAAATVAPAAAVTIAPHDADITVLPHNITEWRKLSEEKADLQQRTKEITRKMKAHEEVILRIMKAHQIGALDLKASGGRLHYKTSKKTEGLGAKTLQKYLTEYLKSEEEARKAIEFILEHRESSTRESLAYENLAAM
jgi:hypothetical protein